MGLTPDQDVPIMPQDALSYNVTIDYVSTKMQPQMLTALIQAMQSGVMDYETVYHNLEAGELTIPGVGSDDVMERIREQAPLNIILPDEEAENEN